MELNNFNGQYSLTSDTAIDIYTKIAPEDVGTEQEQIYDTLQHNTEKLEDQTTPSAKKSTPHLFRCTIVNTIFIGVSLIAVSVCLYFLLASNSKGATVTGIWTNWSVWSPCNVKCGQGFKWRIRTCTSVSPEDNSFDCNGNGTETVQCQNSECSGATVTGIWTNWSVWSPCNVKCGQGFKWRIRTCTSVSPADNGFDCNGNGTETVQCQNSECSDDIWGDWTAWSNCSSQCDKKRTRICQKRSDFGKTCPGNSIETANCDTVLCSFNQLKIRLVDGNARRSGRVEVSLDGHTWGTVCNDLFTDSAATVVCKMLNYPTTSASSNVSVPAGKDPIFLDDVFCTGYESNLLFCKHNGWGKSNCKHDEDVGVSC